MTVAFCAPHNYPIPKPTFRKPAMCVLRRIADIANAAVKRARPLPRVTRTSDKRLLLSDAELSDLTDAVAGVTSEHLAIHRHDFTDTTRPVDGKLISYISVAAKENFTMAVFVMPPGSELPLHDHANMFVVTSVLWGMLEVHEYEPLSTESPSQTYEFDALKQPVSILVPGVARNLTPCRGNIHAFRAREWTAVFDVLVPPYDPDGGRSCHYFAPIPLEQTDRHPDNFDADRVILRVRYPLYQ